MDIRRDISRLKIDADIPLYDESVTLGETGALRGYEVPEIHVEI